MTDREYELWKKYDATQKEANVTLGPHSSYQYNNSRRHLIFTASRYKFAMKMIGGIYEPNEKTILDLGCSDGFGSYYVAEYAKSVLGVDFDEDAIKFAKENYKGSNMEFKLENFLGKRYGEFDGIVSFDVLEHIYPENVERYMETVITNLNGRGGICCWVPKFGNTAIF